MINKGCVLRQTQTLTSKGEELEAMWLFSLNHKPGYTLPIVDSLPIWELWREEPEPWSAGFCCRTVAAHRFGHWMVIERKVWCTCCHAFLQTASSFQLKRAAICRAVKARVEWSLYNERWFFIRQVTTGSFLYNQTLSVMTAMYHTNRRASPSAFYLLKVIQLQHRGNLSLCDCHTQGTPPFFLECNSCAYWPLLRSWGC